MPLRTDRIVGDDLTPLENHLVQLLCSGSDPLSATARRQLARARWGGYEHDGCECFLIQAPVPAETERIAHDGGPFSVAEVLRDHEPVGLLELWVVDGLLHSVNHMPFIGDHVELPAPAEFEFALVEAS